MDNFLYILTGIGSIMVLISCIMVIRDVRKKNFAKDFTTSESLMPTQFSNNYKSEYTLDESDFAKEAAFEKSPHLKWSTDKVFDNEDVLV